jgi:hypothetical protein
VPSFDAGEAPRRSTSSLDDIMSDNDSLELKAAKAELLSATNQLRAVHGYPPLTALPEPPLCSFCARSKAEMGALVQGDDAYICIECAAEAHRTLLGGE